MSVLQRCPLRESRLYIDLAEAKGEVPSNEKTLPSRNPIRVEPAIS